MLTLSDVTLKFRTFAMFVTVKVHRHFRTEFVCGFMMSLHTEFHTHSSSSSTETSIYEFRPAVTLFGFLQSLPYRKFHIFFFSKIYSHTQFHILLTAAM